MNPHQKNKVDINKQTRGICYRIPLPPQTPPKDQNPSLTFSPLAQPKQSLSPEEQRLFRLYGKLPSRSDHFAKHLKERKYFDSGDYALSKAGKADSVDTGAVGSQHPVPENIPHLSSPVGSNGGGAIGGAVPGSANAQHNFLQAHQHHPQGSMQAGSPVKESSFLHRETSADEVEYEAQQQQGGGGGAQSEGIPIRR
ncbi:uncharacterized protein E0L32_007099 [Thyridium curvatum]|uniref:mRNA stability protein n=1 Tax=Thyridium curvatum TaxID=1093900 RepID=A0A507AWW7_9PEZI|nr:uncharacterized protein E0L32_007099 [Thyridium curvatum]TPX12213.1 hypothetical protein E0L32_007099 [Thyridium curvatum]